MNRALKKFKIDGNSNSTSNSRKGGYSMIHSGHYMTSCLHDNDNDDDTVEMPIASPDATNNDVTVAAAELETSSVKSASTTALVSGPPSSQVAGVDDISDVSRAKHEAKTQEVVSGEINCGPAIVSDLAHKYKRALLKVPRGSERSSGEAIHSTSSGDDQIRATESIIKNEAYVSGISNAKILMDARKNMFAILCAQQGSISGGLTLDKANKSLIKLIFYIKTSYSNNLTSPKWKNFKGLKLQVTEKIRINNVIWRSWFEQFGIKDTSKRKRRLICQFSTGLDETSSATATAMNSSHQLSTSATIKMARENKFWKARLESITNEYKKWRELSRKQIKATINNETTAMSIFGGKCLPIVIPEKRSSVGEATKNFSYHQPDKSLHVNQMSVSNDDSMFTSASSSATTSSTAANSSSVIIMSAIPSSSTSSSSSSSSANHASILSTGVIQPSMAPSSNNSNDLLGANQAYGTNSSGGECLNNDLSVQTSNTTSSSTTTAATTEPFPITYQHVTASGSHLNNFIPNGYSSINTCSQNFPQAGSSQSIPMAPTNNTLALQQHHNSPIASKQIPYNNRCRSPSPGLYQDIDLYNFSSDTLFSTYLVEDTKDPVFGTNPDFFQPDLMHLYPNFDFFELCDNDFMTSTTSSSHTSSGGPTKNDAAKSSSSVASSDLQSSHQTSQPPPPPPLATMQASFVETAQQILPNAASVVAPMHSSLPNYSRSMSSNFEEQTHMQSLSSANANSAPVNSQHMAATRKFASLDYSVTNDLSNFDTLVNVAMAQSQAPSAQKQAVVNVAESSSSSMGQFPNRFASKRSLNTSLTTSSSTNTIRNLLAMNTTANSSQDLNKPNRMLMPSSKQYDADNLELSSTSAPSTSSKQMASSSMQLPIISGMQASSLSAIPATTINNPMVSSLNQLVDKNNTFNNNNSKPNTKTLQQVGTVNESNQTINSLLAVLTASSATVANAVAAASSSQAQQSSSLIETIEPEKNTRNNRKNFESQKSTASNSRTSTSQAKLASTSSKSNSKKASNTYQNLSQPSSSSVFDLINHQSSGLMMPTAATINSNSCDHGRNEATSTDINMSNSVSSSLSNSNGDSHYNSDSQYMSGLSAQQLAGSSAASSHGTTILGQNDANDFVLGSQTSSSKMCDNYLNASIISSGLNATSTSMSSVGNGRLNRSNSVSSINTMSEANLTNAEQKRRCNIQHGFDRLQVLVPALLDGRNAKVSKAVMLQKTSEHIKELQAARDKRLNDISLYKRELEELSEKIAECQSQLPASGVAVTGQLNKIERLEQKFTSFVKERTIENWRFYIFSLILKPLFETFLSSVTTSSKEDMERTFTQWQQKSCSLTQLRPIASTALRNLVKNTTILNDASHLPEECLAAVLPKI